MMQEFCDQEKEQARRLIAYAEKWKNHLKQQSPLVSYHTTKRAQLDFLHVPRDLAELKTSTAVEMQQVIDKYRHYVNETYITERLRPSRRRHRRSNEFKKAFKEAHAALREVSGELDALFVQEKKALETVQAAESTCEILELDVNPNEKYIARAREAQKKKRLVLKDIQRQIEKAKEKVKAAQKVYRRRAKEIFKESQSVEEERLDHIRETLLDFIQAIHPTMYSKRLDEIIQKISERITKHQNSFDDLLFWAETYGVDKKSTNNTVSTISESDEEINDDEEEEESLTENLPENRAQRKSHSNHRDQEAQRKNDVNNISPPVTKTRRKTNSEKKVNEPATQLNNSLLNQV